MDNYKELELNILSCYINRPNLMKEVQIDDKYFIYHLKMWKFMKSFYQRFNNFDFVLMHAVSQDKYNITNYLCKIAELETMPNNIYQYKELLIQLYNENKKEKWIINEINDLTNKLCIREISTKSFLEKVNNIYKLADEIFKC